MTFNAEKEIAKIKIWQAPCGCWHSQYPKRWPWFYKPTWSLYRWSPVWLGGDEWCRRTLVIGWDFTGQIIIPLGYCRDENCEGCGPEYFDGSNYGHDPDIQRALRAHMAASQIMHDEVVEKYHRWEAEDKNESA